MECGEGTRWRGQGAGGVQRAHAVSWMWPVVACKAATWTAPSIRSNLVALSRILGSLTDAERMHEYASGDDCERQQCERCERRRRVEAATIAVGRWPAESE